MKYKINEKVYVGDLTKPKEIVDFELIDNQEIYFMSDGTSYHVSQIDLSQKQHNLLKTSLCVVQDQVKEEIVSGLNKYWSALLEREKLRNSKIS